jgi:PAS domain S-box-containing protein
MRHHKKTTDDKPTRSKHGNTLVHSGKTRSSNILTKLSARLYQMLPQMLSQETPSSLNGTDLNQHDLKLQNEELRRAQLYLDSTRARYVDLYELAPVGYCTVNSAGKIMQTNLFISTLLGLPRNQLLQQAIDQFIFKEDLDIYRSLQQELATTNESPSHQLRMIKADGEFTWVNMTVSGEKREAEEPLFHLTLIDVNEHKKAEESQRLASSIFAQTREGILVTDAKGDIVDVNAAFTRITGYTREEVLGKNTRFLQSGHHNEAFYQAIWSSLLAKGYWQGEIWNRKKNGEIYAEMKSISAVFDDQHNVINYVSLFEDITEHARKNSCHVFNEEQRPP